LPHDKRRFPWGLWALVGVIAWVAAMALLGTPIFIFLAPAAGVVLGWIVGGIVFLALGALRGLRPHH
jgi:Na+/proline symporter